jgi:hypothetical protein
VERGRGQGNVAPPNRASNLRQLEQRWAQQLDRDECRLPRRAGFSRLSDPEGMRALMAAADFTQVSGAARGFSSGICRAMIESCGEDSAFKGVIRQLLHRTTHDGSGARRYHAS